MPIIKSAKKKIRQDAKRQKMNNRMRSDYKDAYKLALDKKSKDTVIKAISIIDKTAKRKIIHKNKASRLKARLSKLITFDKKTAKPEKTKAKKSVSKKTAKKTTA
jgi:small subunit ribosomal protein S20